MVIDCFIAVASSANPLLLAVWKQDLDSAKALVCHNARLDLTGRVQESTEHINPIELAIKMGSWDLVELFVHFGYKLSRHSYLLGDDDANIPQSLLDDRDMLSYLRHCASVPMSLFCTTILFIRRYLGTNLADKVSRLPLPLILQNNILFLHEQINVGIWQNVLDVS